MPIGRTTVVHGGPAIPTAPSAPSSVSTAKFAYLNHANSPTLKTTAIARIHCARRRAPGGEQQARQYQHEVAKGPRCEVVGDQDGGQEEEEERDGGEDHRGGL